MEVFPPLPHSYRSSCIINFESPIQREVFLFSQERSYKKKRAVLFCMTLPPSAPITVNVLGSYLLHTPSNYLLWPVFKNFYPTFLLRLTIQLPNHWYL
jgi:hypothetical protein